MYKIEKKFTFPMGHRLSKHKGRCYSLHGHNFTVMVGVKAMHLNDNDMVIDFSDLKSMVNEYIDSFDHCLLLNESDAKIAEQFEKLGMRVSTVPFDPTAEKLAETLYSTLYAKLNNHRVSIDYVTVYENENSKATFCSP